MRGGASGIARNFGPNVYNSYNVGEIIATYVGKIGGGWNGVGRNY